MDADNSVETKISIKTDKRYLTLLCSALLLSVVVVGLGAFTRLTDAGLGCPDWPGCYGFFTVPQSQDSLAKAADAFPDAPVEIQKAWNEMIHRYMAGTLGLLIAAIAFFSWRSPKTNNHQGNNKLLPSVLLLVVCFQAALGMWTVTMNLMPIVVMGHLLGGFTTVSLLLLLIMRERRRISNTAQSASMDDTASRATDRRGVSGINNGMAMSTKIKVLSVSALVAVMLQIALGGWTSANYAALVCTKLPVCETDWVSHYDISAFNPISPTNKTYQYGVLNVEQRVTIHATHRIGAVIVSVLVLLLAMAVRRSLGNVTALGIIAILLLQISLGVTNVVAMLPLSVALAHNLCGMLLLLVVFRTTVRVFTRQVWIVDSSVRETGRLNHG